MYNIRILYRRFDYDLKGDEILKDFTMIFNVLVINFKGLNLVLFSTKFLHLFFIMGLD